MKLRSIDSSMQAVIKHVELRFLFLLIAFLYYYAPINVNVATWFLFLLIAFLYYYAPIASNVNVLVK